MLRIALTVLLVAALSTALVVMISSEFSRRAAPLPEYTATPAGPTPDPWEYDEANDQHWRPGHNHWHDGPPPPPDERQP